MQKHQATIKEIAQALNVSVSTVSRALKQDPRIGLRTRNRVQELAKQLHYVPNPGAVQLRKHRTLTIGVVLPSLREEFFSMALTGIEDILSENGYNVLVSQSREQQDREQKIIDSFIRSRVDGVIASVSATTVLADHFHTLREFGIPIVFFDRALPDFPAHRVRCNVLDGVQKAMHYLVETKGLRDIALLNGPPALEISKERLAGFLTAVESLGLDLPETYLKSVDLSEPDTCANMEALCFEGPRPQAILAFNDYVALHAMQWCKRQGWVPNKDITFVSFANLPITAYMDNPPAASIDQFAVEMGAQAAGILLEALQAEGELPFREVVLDTDLVVHQPKGASF